MKGSAKIEFENLRCDCFAMISWPLTSKSSLKIIRIETGERRVHYLSVWGSSSNPSGGRRDNGSKVIKVNGKFAKILKLKNAEFVLFSEVDDKITAPVTHAKVSCCSPDDWEILETNAEYVSTNLLNQLRVVYPGQEFPFWLSKSMVIYLRIDEITPATEFGILASNTQVIIPSLSTPGQLTLPKGVGRHRKLRVHSLFIPESLSLLPTEALLFSNELHGFTFKAHMNHDHEKDGDIQQDSIVIEINVDQAEKQRHFVRLFFLDNLESSVASIVLPFVNIANVYLHPQLLKKIRVPEKSWVWVSAVPENEISQMPVKSSLPRSSTMEPSCTRFYGFQPILDECAAFIKSSLSLGQSKLEHFLTGSGHGCMLIHGPNGSGKSSIAQRVAQLLTRTPYHVHFEHVSCAKLRGKKAENVEKELVKILRILEEMQPSLLILDDFDVLASSPKEEASRQEEFLQFKINETLLETILRFKHNRIAVVCTSVSPDSLHSYWKSRPGFHFFQKFVKIHSPTKAERLEIFFGSLKRYLWHSESDNLRFTALNSQSNQIPNNKDEGSTTNSICNKEIGVGAMQYYEVEGSVDSDLTKQIAGALSSIHEQNATPQFLVNVAKKWGAYVQQISLSNNCDKTGAAVLESRHVPTSVVPRRYNIKINEDVNEQMRGFNEILEEEIRFSGDLDELSKNKHNQRQRITMDSVGGLTSVKEELKKVLEWPIKYPQFFRNAPIRLPSGILLYGYPGTGKSLVGLALQTAANVKFIHVKGPELLSKYIGASEKAVQDVFNRARDSRPCILFFDEFDSLVPRRGHDSTGVTDRVVNQFLSEMDGIDGGLGEGVYLIAATSRPDLIDPAVLRPGRLDKHLFFNLPNQSERREIVEKTGSKVNLQLDDESALNEISNLTEGFTGADLNALMFSAQLAVVHEYLSKVNNGQRDGTELEGQSCCSVVSSAAATSIPTMSRQEIKVTKESVLCALKDFKPSVQGKELSKFQAIYQGFSLSRSGGAKQLSSVVGTKLTKGEEDWEIEPGKRATLA